MVFFQEALGVDHVFEALLGFEAGGREDAAVQVPEAQTLQVSGAALIVQDEGRYAVAQALLEHEKPTDPAVPVVKGPDALKAHVEVQDLQQCDLRQPLVLPQELTHLGVDVLGRGSFQFFQVVGLGAVDTDAAFAPALVEGAVEHLIVQPLDVGLGQRLGGGVDDVIHAEHMVGGLDKIVHLDGFEAGLDLVCVEDFRDLGEHQPVAGHAPVRVGKVGLYVVIKAVEHLFSLLLPEFFDQERLGLRNYRLVLSFLTFRFLRFFWNIPY